ncbi:DUF6660 family protein [Fibrella sp. WM1]|uniref:DUF6660 family protein n=1 Tax=Fibrella musci TaxID=3242485 RepID=UPI0035219049
MTTRCICWVRTFAAVKWLTTILAIYLMMLSLWPCADEAMTTRVPVTTDVVVAAPPSHPASHQHDHDQCTPFCTCSCCAATITAIPRFSYSLGPAVRFVAITTDGFCYAPTRWVAPPATIWQPPQRRV